MKTEEIKRFFRTASLLFFLSGLAGLAYEVIWFKRFSHVWGNSSLAMAAVVASFLFGLAVGAQRFGRIADRSPLPLRWYGACEAAIGILALLIPFEIQGLIGFSSALYSWFSQYVWAHTFLRFLLTFLVIGPPCILMGGTLPLLIKQFTPPDSPRNEAAGWLYAVNTLGAACGCYLTGFHLLPSLGLLWTNILIAALNLFVAMESYRLARKLQKVIGETTKSTAEAEASHRALERNPTMRNSLPILYLCSAGTGFAALILEMVWTRQLALILGGTTYAFTSMLFVILIGIGLGSFLFSYHEKIGTNPFRALTGCIFLLILSTLLGYFLIPYLTLFVGYARLWRAYQIANALICIAVSAVLELVPAVMMGFLFPLFIALARTGDPAVGKAVGNLYAWNTLGSILGASLTSLIFIVYLGSAGTIALALLLYSAVPIFFIRHPHRKYGWPIPISLFLGCLMVMGTLKNHDPLVTHVGLFMYGGVRIHTLKIIRDLLFFQEGPTCSVLVTSELDNRALRVNGKVDASTTGDMATQLGSCYIPFFLRPQSRNVMVVGFGSGTTSGAALLFPDTKVTCCEIEPAVFAASPYFSAVNHSPERSPRFSMILDDGRNFLQATRDRYDLIISEPSNPWMAGLANLFTREYYLAVKKRLLPGGIFIQWIQTYAFTLQDYAMVARTIMGVFPHYALYTPAEGDTLLLASDSPLTPSAETLRTAQSQVDSLPPVVADLEKYFGTKDIASLLFTHALLDESGLRNLIHKDPSTPIHTDLNLRLEFDAPLRLFLPLEPPENLYKQLLASVDPNGFLTNFTNWECGKGQLNAWKELTDRFSTAGIPAVAVPLAQFGEEQYPDDPHFLAEQLKWMPPDQAKLFTESFQRLLPLSVEEAFRIGLSMETARQYRRAIEVYEGITQVHPNYATPWAHLGVCRQAVEEYDQAEIGFKKALELDPFNEYAAAAYERFTNQMKSKKP